MLQSRNSGGDAQPILARSIDLAIPDNFPSSQSKSPQVTVPQNISFLSQASRNGSHSRNEIHNRLTAILVHIAWYSFKTQVRLAQDTGLSKAAISRISRGFHRPSYPAALLITRALEDRLQRTLDPREIFSIDGTYPTPSVCSLVGCRNCLPEAAYSENGIIRSEYKDLKAGQWSMSILSSSSQGKSSKPDEQSQIQSVR